MSKDQDPDPNESESAEDDESVEHDLVAIFAGEGEAEFEELLAFIELSRGFNLSGYKRATLRRRIAKRISDVGLTSITDYRAFLESRDDEFPELFNTILINVTSFMRDTFAWDYLRATLVPEIIAAHKPNDPIRIWSAGCASGEEAYGLAILFAEALGPRRFAAQVKVYATDIDEDALQQARYATFKTKDVRASVPADLAEKYFRFSDGTAYLDKDVRRQVIFGRNDLLRDPPISRIDLLACRNTLMYFNADVQNKVLDSFYFALREGGFLFLGKSEVLLTRNHVFRPVDLKRRIFTKAPGNRRYQKRVPVENPPKISARTDLPPVVIPAVLNVNFDTSGLAEIIIDSDQMVTAINQQARTLFGLSSSDVGAALKDLEMSYRPVELRSRVEQVQTDLHEIVIRDVRIVDQSGTENYLEVQINPLVDDNKHFLGVSITFNDVTRYKFLQDQLRNSNAELEKAYEELQSMVEELETTNEELQSTNEELETTNEELQSTNEELETMNEELQSSNEELETINDELRSRTEDLNLSNLFLEKILGTLNTAVVVIGREMEILVWSENSEELWGLRNEEVLGRNFMNLDIGLPVELLHQPLKRVLSGKSAEDERLALASVNRRGKAFECTIQISGLSMGDGDLNGAILLMGPAAPKGSGGK